MYIPHLYWLEGTFFTGLLDPGISATRDRLRGRLAACFTGLDPQGEKQRRIGRRMMGSR